MQGQPLKISHNPNIDAVRGLAVLGIFFLNVSFMGVTLYGYAPFPEFHLTDAITETLSNFLLEGRFLSLFSMLFGVGLYIQQQNFLARGLEPFPLIRSRLLWLMLFGALHSLFIWPGDILLTYSICGFLAWHYRNLEIEAQQRRALLFIAIGTLAYGLMILLPGDETWIRGNVLFNEQYSAWTGSYGEQLLMHLFMTLLMLISLPFTLLWFVSGVMLLGISLYRRGLFDQGLPQGKLGKLLALSLLLSLADTILSLQSRPKLVMLSDILVMLSAIPMAIIYVHLLVKFGRRLPWLPRRLQAVGRIPLSLYILQSCFGIWLFRHQAPELLLTLERIDYLVIALGYALVQIILAGCYLKFFKQGPLEWLWRRLAFGNKPINNATNTHESNT
ncbi:MAG: DUF418 domain-containing protein [Shewanella algae]